MNYFGLNYTKGRAYRSWQDWAWWIVTRRTDTYYPDIKSVFFLRILGVEFKVHLWLPKPLRQQRQHISVVKDGGVIEKST